MSSARTLCMALCTFSIVLVAGGRALGGSYLPPPGGYIYAYEANAGEDSPGTGPASYDALDGTFGYGNNSDTWDGTGIGVGAPGGVSVIDGSYLRIQDTGDPRDYGFPDPSSRKIYLAHKLTPDGLGGNFLDAGVTIHFRIRLATTPPLDDRHPDGGAGTTPWPAGGDGYQVHDNGKGMVAIRQAAGGIISFSLALPSDHAEITEPSLITNHLNGAAASGDVDTGDTGTPNAIPLNPTEWHELWVTIQAGGTGTHVVSIYRDGSTIPTTFNVTSGIGDDIGDSYIAFGDGSTGQSGAFDVDFARVIDGVQEPQVPTAIPLSTEWGLGFLAVALCAAGLLCLRRNPASA